MKVAAQIILLLASVTIVCALPSIHHGANAQGAVAVQTPDGPCTDRAATFDQWTHAGGAASEVRNLYVGVVPFQLDIVACKGYSPYARIIVVVRGQNGQEILRQAIVGDGSGGIPRRVTASGYQLSLELPPSGGSARYAYILKPTP